MLKHKLSFEGLDNSIFELVLERKEGNKDKQEIMDYLETQFVNAQKYMPFCTKHQTCLNPDLDFDRNLQLESKKKKKIFLRLLFQLLPAKFHIILNIFNKTMVFAKSAKHGILTIYVNLAHAVSAKIAHSQVEHLKR